MRLKSRSLGTFIVAAFIFVFISLFNNCSGFVSQLAVEGAKVRLQSAQASSQYDPRLRYSYVNADVDGNGVEDSLVFDRRRSNLIVRLFGKFPAGHPYYGINQSECQAKAIKFAGHLDLGPQPNLDYCNSIVRPEEDWGTVPLQAESGSIQISKGRFSAKDRDDLVLFSSSQVTFATAKRTPDTIGKRPGLTERLVFSFKNLDLTQLDLCAAVAASATELATCRKSDRWKNLARPWEQVTVADFNQDGLDDLIGLVSVDDDDPKSEIGLWALLSTQKGEAITHAPVLLATLTHPYKTNRLFIGNFDGDSEPPQALFLWPRDGVATQLRFICRSRETNGRCRQIVPRDSLRAFDFKTVVDGGLPYAIDETAVDSFIKTQASSLRLRIKATGAPTAKEYVLSKSSTVGEWALKVWTCPWQASILDGIDANNACLSGKDLTQDAAARSLTRTLVINPAGCGANCTPYIQRLLDEPTIRNVVLTAGTYPLQGTLYVSSLNANGLHQKLSKRLIGLTGAVLKGSSAYNNPDGSAKPSPTAPADIEAERKQMGKCREARDDDLTDADYSDLKKLYPVEPRAGWYRDYLFNQLLIRGNIARTCPMVQTEGSHVTVSGFVFDMTDLARVQAAVGRARNFVGINLGFSVNEYAAGEYDQDGNVIGALPANRVNDSSRAPDEDLRFVDLRFENVAMVGAYTTANPQSPRNVLFEDLSCAPYQASLGFTDSDCVALNGSQSHSWPYDSSYRQFAPFAPQNVENVTFRKGPHDSSYCVMKGNSETFRMASVTGVVVDGCTIYTPFSGGPALFLYTQDTGAKLGITLRRLSVIHDLDIAPLRSNGVPMGAYSLVRQPYTPKRFDSAGQELFQPVETTNDPLITIAGRAMARNTVIDKLEFVGGKSFLDNAAYNARIKFDHAAHIYRETPSEVFIDGLTSSISVGRYKTQVDEKMRYHISEVKGLSGKFICRNCHFTNGARAFSASESDLWGIREACRTEITNKDLSQLTDDKIECKNSNSSVETGISKHNRSLIPGSRFIVGYHGDGTPVLEDEPSVVEGSTHGSWFEFIDSSSTGLSGAAAVVIHPGYIGDGRGYQTMPANGPLNGLIKE